MNTRPSSICSKDVDLEGLAKVIREKGQPVHVNVLARASVQSQLEAEAGQRSYVPGARYIQGETIRFRRQSATVKSVRIGGNPKQGRFNVLTLVLADGTERYMAAEVPGAPAQGRQPVTNEQVDRIIKEHGLAFRTAIQEAMSTDDRFVWFQDTRGDHWCLAEMLPGVGDEELGKVADVLVKELDDGEPVSKTTEELIRAVWGAGDDGSNTYALRAFALGQVLLSCVDVEPLGGRWVWTETWEAFTEREPLAVPRIHTQEEIAAGIPLASEAEAEEELRKEEVIAHDVMVADENVELEDLEAWRRNRPGYAVFTLSAPHYYEGWLPLTKQVERLFPPLEAGKQEVIFHHHFGNESESFRSWVDQERQRIWVSKDMYETFRCYGIYPGARLRVSYRTEREYDVATRPTTKTEPVRVWRMWLEDGEIRYSDDLEPRQYDIDDDVFVADVRFEDREALFQQAMSVGKSIFNLMWDQAKEWWEAHGGQDLYVTVEDLFEAIHYDEQGRMTSKATIAWEFWRRLAFKSAGSGKYLFQPRFGALVRRAGIRARLTPTRTIKETDRGHKTRSLTEIARKTQYTEREVDTAKQLKRPKASETAKMDRRILIRYVPKAGGRTSQVHFTREIAENYFHFVLGQPQTIRLQQLQLGSDLGPIESRPLVYSESNRNCRIEVSGARELGEHYPASGQRPIIVFEEVEEDLFRYVLLMPGDDGFAELAAHLDALPQGRALASDISDLGTILQIWPDYPISA